MRKLLEVAAVAAVVALAVHVGLMFATPYGLMRLAMARISQKGAHENVWIRSPRTTERSRGIVRPSPDLAYASCVYDLSHGPIRVTAAPWGDYMSVSVFQANSDNIYVVDDRQAPAGVDFVLAKAGQTAPPGAPVVLSSSTRGIVLTRRLAPTPARFQAARAADRNDVCGPPAR